MFCPNCGSEILENAKFCPKCGAKAKTKGKSAEKKIRLGYIAGAAAVVLVVAVGLWGFSRAHQDDSIVKLGASMKSHGITFECHSDGTASVVRSKNIFLKVKDVVIPSKVKYKGETYSVTEIGDNAFYNFDSLTSIEIPDSVTKIGDGAFSLCSGLTSIEIPASVTEIGEGAFSHCGLTSIEIPASVTKIGDSGAFGHCSGLTSIKISDGVTEIWDSAFNGCDSLTSIEIPDGVTKIGDGAFYSCSSLTSVEIPEGVTKIGKSAFNNCGRLTSVELPASVTEIGEDAFGSCSGLASVKVGGVETGRNEVYDYVNNGYTQDKNAGNSSSGILRNPSLDYMFGDTSGLR